MASRYSNNVLTTSLSELSIYTIDSVGIVPCQRLSWFPSFLSSYPRTRANANRREFYSVKQFPQLRHHLTGIIESTKPVITYLHLASPNESITIYQVVSPNFPLLASWAGIRKRLASQCNHYNKISSEYSRI